MPTLGSANSILELAFGANFVLAAIFARSTKSRAEVAGFLAAEFAKRVPEFSLTPEQRHLFNGFVFSRSRVLRFHHKVARVPVACSVTVTIVAVLGLIASALDPNINVPSSLVVGFGLFALLGTPLLYYLFHRLSDFIPLLIVARINVTDEAAREWIQSFAQWQQQGSEQSLAMLGAVLRGIRYRWQIALWREKLEHRAAAFKIGLRNEFSLARWKTRWSGVVQRLKRGASDDQS